MSDEDLFAGRIGKEGTGAKTAWDPKTQGYGKHDYQKIDPATINPEDYARNLRGEEAHFGDVREYNSASNVRHPKNTVTLDDLCRVGTVIETEAEGFEGRWMVVQMPVVHSPKSYARLARVDEVGEPVEGTLVEVCTIDLGCAVDATNQFKQVRTVMIQRGRLDRTQRERLTKR